MTDSKTCTKCGTSKEPSAFHRRTRSSDGLMSQCKECVNVRIRANYAADPARKKARTRAYHLANPEWSTRVLREWHERNRDRRSAEVRERLLTDPAFREYRRDVVARHERERRAQKAGTEYTRISKDDYDSILEEHDNRCWICDVELDRAVWDHVQPLAKGGAHVVVNLRPACAPCNTRKNARWPFTEEMRQQLAAEVRLLRASAEEVMS